MNREPGPQPVPDVRHAVRPAGPLTPGVTRPLTPGVATSPAALGVQPDARLATAFLSQAFLWMFAGLLVTAGVAYVVQEQRAAARVRRRELLPAVHRPDRRSSS